MTYNYSNDVKLFMVFDILGDTVRTGPQLWFVNRKRLENVKNHILDLLLIARILQKKLPSNLDFNKINDYILCHDLPEAITGDITKFEGVPKEEIERVTKIATDYLSDQFGDVLDLNKILNQYENRIDIESKVVHMIDRVHSASTFIKYQSEKNIDMDNPRIIKDLRDFVVKKIKKGHDLADFFFEFHMTEVTISDEECNRYSISREDADKIVNAIRGFANELYHQKQNRTLLEIKNTFPTDAMKYNRNKCA